MAVTSGISGGSGGRPWALGTTGRLAGLAVAACLLVRPVAAQRSGGLSAPPRQGGQLTTPATRPSGQPAAPSSLGGVALGQNRPESPAEYKTRLAAQHRAEKAKADAAWTNTALAPPPPPPAGTELIGGQMNGEQVAPLADHWDGVDSGGNLRAHVAPNLVLDDVGNWHNVVFPASVNMVDMNDDDLADIVAGDQFGYLWIFFNSGKPGAPVFTTGRIAPTYIGLRNRIHLVDWDGDGDQDVIVGTLPGQFQVLYNIGTAKEPKFTKTMGIPRFGLDDPADRLQRFMLVKRAAVGRPEGGLGGPRDASETDRRLGAWGAAGGAKIPFEIGVYMTPWVIDWDKDGKLDMIFGEGSYSANSVRIAFNLGGSNLEPIFRADATFFLAYGEGYEQLVPAVVDYNGDGIPDLMTGTRTGEIRLYKGTGRAVEAAHTFRGMKGPAAMDFDGNLPLAGQEVFETMTAPFPVDWNDDGLFDLLLGSTSGRILLSLNRGTKEKPHFPNVAPIQGTDVDKDRVAPSGWSGTVGRDETCNSAGYLSAEKAIGLIGGAKPFRPLVVNNRTENETALADNGQEVKPVAGERFLYYRYRQDYPGWVLRGEKWIPGARGLGTERVGTMVIGRQYTFSFSYVLVAGGPVQWGMISYEGFRSYDAEQSEEWNEVIYNTGVAARSVSNTPALMPTAGAWQKASITFTCPGTQNGQKMVWPQVNVPQGGAAQSLNFNIAFALPAGDCDFLLDNFSLKETGGPRP